MSDEHKSAGPVNLGGHEYWSRSQAAQFLCVNMRTVDNWCRKCGMPFRKVGNKVLLDSHELQTFLKCKVVAADGSGALDHLLTEDGDGHLGINGSNDR